MHGSGKYIGGAPGTATSITARESALGGVPRSKRASESRALTHVREGIQRYVAQKLAERDKT